MVRAAVMLVRRNGKAPSNMKQLQLIFIAALAGAVLAGAGCSKQESEQAPPPPTTTTINRTEQPSPKSESPSTAGVKVAATDSGTNAPGEAEETPEQLAAQVKQLENDYKN